MPLVSGFVGHLAHRRGPQSGLVDGAGVQAHDAPWTAIPTMGEAWHNNHHALPGSAKIRLRAGQSDWGYAFIRLLKRMGLAWDIVLPEQFDRSGMLIQVTRDTLSSVRNDLGKHILLDQHQQSQQQCQRNTVLKGPREHFPFAATQVGDDRPRADILWRDHLAHHAT